MRGKRRREWIGKCFQIIQRQACMLVHQAHAQREHKLADRYCIAITGGLDGFIASDTHCNLGITIAQQAAIINLHTKRERVCVCVSVKESESEHEMHCNRYDAIMLTRLQAHTFAEPMIAN
jgi:hypothetical protein